MSVVVAFCVLWKPQMWHKFSRSIYTIVFFVLIKKWVMVCEATHNSKFHAKLGEGGVQGSKRVGKMWKTLKELNVQRLTGQMRMWRKCGNSIDKLLSVGMLAEEIKFIGRNCEEGFIEDAYIMLMLLFLIHLLSSRFWPKKSVNLNYPPYYPDFVPCETYLKIL